MKLEKAIQKRKIEELLHFTTNYGITGILSSREIKARGLLPQDKHLKDIVKFNCKNRSRDVHWVNFVNLSITNTNKHLFEISSNKWHDTGDNWWCIISFDPIIATHKNVYFTTTNNMYTGVSRKKGIEGFESLFADKIVRWEGNIIDRKKDLPNNQPTCEQAEVLYPNQISLRYVKKIYVENQESLDKLESIKACFPDLNLIIPCEVNRQLFGKEDF